MIGILLTIAIFVFFIWYALEQAYRLKQLGCDRNWGRGQWFLWNLISQWTMGIYPMVAGNEVKDVRFVRES